MAIVQVDNLKELNDTLKKNSLSVVEFFATWCGPCHAIAPTFISLAQKYKNIKFLKVDVDEGKGIALQQSVSAMPTFQFFQNGKKVDELKGANSSILEQRVKQLTLLEKRMSNSFSGSGRVLSASSNRDLNLVSRIQNSNQLIIQAGYFFIAVAILAIYRYFN